MNYIVFDMEWNQPVDAAAAVQEPVYLSGEIVQIGAVKLNDAFEPVSELRLLIRPKFYEKMHRKIATLTGVYDKQLREEGVSFPEAYKTFTDWCGDDYAVMTWSQTDMQVMIENMMVHGLDVSNLPDIIDVQRIFGREIMRTDRRVSLEEAMEVLGLHGDRAHDALNDSRNTVQVCSRMDLDGCVDEYITRIYADTEPHRGYEESRQILEDAGLLETVCPWCGEKMTGEGWIPGRYGMHQTRFACPEGDELLALLMRSPMHPSGFRPQRIFYEMSDDLWDQYCDAKEQAESAAR